MTDDRQPAAATAATATSDGGFSSELEIRIVEAQTSLAAAEALDDELSAQIAAGDLADLQALASRNDLPTEPQG